MNISFFGNDRQFQSLKKEWLSRAEAVWASGQFFFGPQVEKLEHRLATMCQRKYAIALASCTDALAIATEYLDLEAKSKVLITNYSFSASAAPILKNNLVPSFVDINRQLNHPTYKNYQKFWDKECKAVIAVSLYGNCYAMDETEIWADKKKIPLIEDAAQSFGSSLGDRPAGSFGIASCISFDPTKIIAASSLAGALLTDDQELYEFALRARFHGKNRNNQVSQLGGKSLMSSVEAEILQLKLDHLDSWLNKRNEIANTYIDSLSGVGDLILPTVLEGGSHTFHKFVIATCERDRLAEYLMLAGIVVRRHYKSLLSQEPVFSKYSSSTPNASEASYRNLSLPLYQELRDEEIKYIIDTILRFFG